MRLGEVFSYGIKMKNAWDIFLAEWIDQNRLEPSCTTGQEDVSSENTRDKKQFHSRTKKEEGVRKGKKQQRTG
jgi:hypothetical protein